MKGGTFNSQDTWPTAARKRRGTTAEALRRLVSGVISSHQWVSKALLA
ncbi:hypothetical protein [Desulfosarcina widdelii]|nr:hypothetical protein [Desulfosarcina widdelii]